MNHKIIVLLLVIAMVILFAASCTEKTQTEDSSLTKQEEIQSSMDEQSDALSLSMDINEDQDQGTISEGKISNQENNALLNDTINTLNDLEATINSLDEVSDSDLQIPE